jgi:hypothetical protein
MKLVMTLLVRDSGELLRHNLEYHLRQGVDFFIVTDNRSTDGTPAIIDEYVRAGLAMGLTEPEDTFSQSRWVTRMARLAASEHRADWVINNDDDEFWSAEGGLKPALAAAPADRLALEVQRRNHPPVAGVRDELGLGSMIYREGRSLSPLGLPLPPKVCHRGLDDIEIGQGNHAVLLDGEPLPAMPTDRIAISHFPLRGYAAFERKIALGGAAYARNAELGPQVGATWRWLYGLLKRGALREWYERQLLAPEALLAGLRDGSLVLDDSVARTLGLPLEDPCAPVA